MTQHNSGGADNPLQGRPPAPDEMNENPSNPNAAVDIDNQPEWKDRPGQYPAAKEGLGSPDVPADRKVGQRPDGGSARIVEPSDDGFFPTAVPVERPDEDHILRLSKEADMIEKGYTSISGEDDGFAGGTGEKRKPSGG